ncbi:MAG: DoxX family protein [bacterium]
MKKHKIIFWITTTIIFLFEGVMPALTSQSQMSIDGITNLGYPLYFVTMLTVFKVAGAIVLIVPKFPKNMKEWAYAGFGIDFICAFWSIWAVAGFGPMLLIPAVAFVILAISYKYYHKLQAVTAPVNL